MKGRTSVRAFQPCGAAAPGFTERAKGCNHLGARRATPPHLRRGVLISALSQGGCLKTQFVESGMLSKTA
jgi:hypothetical protein